MRPLADRLGVAVALVLALTSNLGTAFAAPTLVHAPGSAGSKPTFRVFEVTPKGIVYSSSIDGKTELWSSDGTSKGTAKLAIPSPNIQNCLGCAMGVKVHGGSVFYFRDTYSMDVEYPEAKLELYRTDGTTAGTALVGAVGVFGEEAPLLGSVGGTLYFVTRNTSKKQALYKVDAAGLSISLVGELGVYRSLEVVGCNGKLFVAAAGGGGSTAKLWVSGGTAATTHVIYESPAAAKAPSTLSCLGSRLYFSDGDYRARWTDGAMVTPPLHTSVVRSGFGRAPTGSSVQFFVSAMNTNILTTTDGTNAGTSAIAPGYGSVTLPASGLGAALFFAATGTPQGNGLWRTDGTKAGTYALTDGALWSEIAVQGNRAYFTFDDGVHGTEVWESDGTKAGTKLFADVRSGPDGSEPTMGVGVGAAGMREFGGDLYFFANDGVQGEGLYRLGLASTSGGGSTDPKDGPTREGSDSAPDEGTAGGNGEGSEREVSSAASAGNTPDVGGCSTTTRSSRSRAPASGAVAALVLTALLTRSRRRSPT